VKKVTLADLASPNPSPEARKVTDRAMLKVYKQQQKVREQAEKLRTKSGGEK